MVAMLVVRGEGEGGRVRVIFFFFKGGEIGSVGVWRWWTTVKKKLMVAIGGGEVTEGEKGECSGEKYHGKRCEFYLIFNVHSKLSKVISERKIVS